MFSTFYQMFKKLYTYFSHLCIHIHTQIDAENNKIKCGKIFFGKTSIKCMQGFFVLKLGLKFYPNKKFDSSLYDRGFFKLVFTTEISSLGSLIRQTAT